VADKAAGKVNFEADLRARPLAPAASPRAALLTRFSRAAQDHLAQKRLECDRRVQRAFSLLEAKDPDLRTGVPSVSALVDVPEAHALDADVAAAEAAASGAAKIVADPGAEARARAAIDARALAQATACAAGFEAFTSKLLAAGDAPRQAELAERAAAKLKEAEAAGEEGRVDDAQRLTDEAEQIKRIAAVPPPKPIGVEMGGGQKLHVCDVCSAQVSLYDNERRLADHFGGKAHLGYAKIRDRLADMARRGVTGGGGAGRYDGGGGGYGGGDRHGGGGAPPAVSRPGGGGDTRPRERSRERDRDRDRERERDRSRERRRERSRERRKHRSRSRSRSRDKHRRRSRSRDRR
jgi:hypothetical protein